MLAFTLTQVKHGLFIRRGKIRARVLGRMFPTIETDAGRAAVCPPRLAGWLADMQIQAEPRRVLQARLAEA